METRCLDTAYVGLPMLLVMGLSGLSGLWIFALTCCLFKSRITALTI